MDHKHRIRTLAAGGPGNKPRGEIAVALILALGAVIERARAPRSGWITAGPVILVNYVAFRAQLRFWQAYLDRSDALLVSVALESVAVYLAWQAHRALVKNDSALRLRLAAYGWAAGMGVLNYSHYMQPGWRPTVAAVTFGMMSAVSPWLWSIHSRRESRDDLKAQDLIDDHAVRLGLARWFWYPLRSAVVQRLAAWAGENRPAAAIALYEQRRAERAARKAGGSYAQEGSRDAGVTAVPAVTAEKPSPVPASRNRETASGVVPGRAARTTGLVAASVHEQEVILRLVTAGQPLPSIRDLAASDFGGSIRASQRVLKLASSQMNGAGRDHADRT